MVRIACTVGLLLVTFAVGRADTSAAANAHAVFQTHCQRCHGENGTVEGGFNYAVDLARLSARKKVVPGRADLSPIFKRIVDGSMPPADVTKRLSEDEIKAVRGWIDAGAPPLESARPRTFVTNEIVEQWVLADLEKIDRRARRFQRYFTLVPLWNAGAASDELQTYRNALSKVLNSLSWHPKITNPAPIDPDALVFRIDLRQFMWDATQWNRLLQDYPYGILDDGTTSRTVAVFTATKVPIIRADWFAATASRPLLYQDLLQLPGNLAELERQLRVDVTLNISQERVVRTAFNGSGIARNNRVLERHDAVHGYYWRTYDFEDVPQNLLDRGLAAPDRRNVFAYPLGPGSVENTFLHAGGEAIFSLPNGLQGYYIMNAVNNRIDKAPTAIVADPKRPDRAVELGVSCMGCHVPGIISKADQMRDHLLTNPKGITKTDREIALALYPGKDVVLARMAEDSKKYLTALEQTGNKVTRTESVIAVTQRFEGDLDLVTAASEAGLPVAEFQARIGESELLSGQLGALRVSGGTVHRAVWVQAFADVVKELRIGTLFQATQIGTLLPDNTGELDPLESSAGQINAAVFAAGGKTVLMAAADRSVRVHEVEGRRDLKRLIGHSGSVWSVARSADGKRAISGGMDGFARVWDVEGGRENARFDAHTGLVTAVAINRSGTEAATGGIDGWVIVWDLETRKEVKRWKGPMKYVQAVSFSPDGSTLAIGADRSVYLWTWEGDEKPVKLEGHAAAVTTTVWSADGVCLATGSDDRTIRIWHVADRKAERTLTGHLAAVRSVDWSPNGKWLLSASADATVRLWKLDTGAEAGVFRKHADPVVSAAFVGDRPQTVSVDRAGRALVWSIERFLPKK